MKFVARGIEYDIVRSMCYEFIITIPRNIKRAHENHPNYNEYRVSFFSDEFRDRFLKAIVGNYLATFA